MSRKERNQGRPNILWIVTDHHAYYGHEGVKRPVFERLAEEGGLFSQAYCSTPLCCPSRKSMLTGLYACNHGQINNAVSTAADKPETYLEVLKAAGYTNYYIGKWHAGGGSPADLGCRGLFYPGYSNPYHQPEYREYLRRNGLPPAEMLVEKNMCEPGWIDEAEEGKIYSFTHGLLNEVLAGRLVAPRESHEAFYYADAACRQLEDIRRNGEEKPFSMRLDLYGPHQPYHPTEQYAAMYPPESIKLPDSYKDELIQKPSVYQFETGRGISCEKKLKRPGSVSISDWQVILSRCYGQITLIDDAVGQVLDKLDELGFREDTLVIWTSDHGDAIACHGGHTDKSAYMPEEVMRIPLALRFPGVITPGQVYDMPVSNVDLAPTVLEAAGAAFREPPDGLSLLRLLIGNGPGRDAVYAETYGHAFAHVGKMVVEGKIKYIYNQGDMEELYDLEKDPSELHNLCFDPDMGSLLNHMRMVCREIDPSRNSAISTMTHLCT